MLKHAKGNLLNMAEAGDFDVIVHGCNCMNVMGGGIAREIRERFPMAFDADVEATKIWKHPIAKLGNFSYAAIHGNKLPFIIINAYTQVNTSNTEDVFEYESFSLILRKLLTLAIKGTRFGFPYIGMGLAGGDKTRIMPMLEDFAAKATELGAEVTLVEFAP